MPKKEANGIENITYEQAYAELEQIVTALEGNQSSLEDSIQLFERGKLLAEHCAKLLESAELKVKKLSTADQVDTTD
jgi:exodeoxyribonuclease VII small subunit